MLGTYLGGSISAIKPTKHSEDNGKEASATSMSNSSSYISYSDALTIFLHNPRTRLPWIPFSSCCFFSFFFFASVNSFSSPFLFKYVVHRSIMNSAAPFMQINASLSSTLLIVRAHLFLELNGIPATSGYFARMSSTDTKVLQKF
jgi:hypothetical protein